MTVKMYNELSHNNDNEQPITQHNNMDKHHNAERQI